MNKFINYSDFMHYLISDEKAAEKGGEIVQGILKAKSPRISRIADEMPGRYEANYKMIQRFLKSADLKTGLQRCFDAEAEFVLGDPTEIERAGARKTDSTVWV